MTKKSKRSAQAAVELAGPATTATSDNPIAPGTTGRFLVLMREGDSKSGVKALRAAGGMKVASSSDFDAGAVDAGKLAGADGVMLEKLGVAILDAPPEQINEMRLAAADGESAILAVEPERIVHVAMLPTPSITAGESYPTPMGGASGVPLDYFAGYRDAVNFLVDKMLGASGEPELTAAALNEAELTWGLQVTRAAASRFTGAGIRVAVLDTGLDLRHPDFGGRRITSKSFVQGESVQDGHGHGTHCIGTACGPRTPGQLPRYGIAFNAAIFAGKVLSNGGSGGDGGILAGIEWAVTNRCHIVSMSLGAPVQPGQSFSRVFENAARRAQIAGTLVIAAAGNDSNRPSDIAPVSHPANCPSIIAVAALDAQMRIASFSNGGLNAQGGQVDIAGPGVKIRSSWPRPTLYNTISGTSMATPHVAGLAALHAEARGARGAALAQLLTQSARRLSLSARDVGAGLVQAP
jgi:subtilisin